MMLRFKRGAAWWAARMQRSLFSELVGENTVLYLDGFFEEGIIKGLL